MNLPSKKFAKTSALSNTDCSTSFVVLSRHDHNFIQAWFTMLICWTFPSSRTSNPAPARIEMARHGQANTLWNWPGCTCDSHHPSSVLRKVQTQTYEFVKGGKYAMQALQWQNLANNSKNRNSGIRKATLNPASRHLVSARIGPLRHGLMEVF